MTAERERQRERERERERERAIFSMATKKEPFGFSTISQSSELSSLWTLSSVDESKWGSPPESDLRTSLPKLFQHDVHSTMIRIKKLTKKA